MIKASEGLDETTTNRLYGLSQFKTESVTEKTSRVLQASPKQSNRKGSPANLGPIFVYRIKAKLDEEPSTPQTIPDKVDETQVIEFSSSPNEASLTLNIIQKVSDFPEESKQADL